MTNKLEEKIRIYEERDRRAMASVENSRAAQQVYEIIEKEFSIPIQGLYEKMKSVDVCEGVALLSTAHLIYVGSGRVYCNNISRTINWKI